MDIVSAGPQLQGVASIGFRLPFFFIPIHQTANRPWVANDSRIPLLGNIGNGPILPNLRGPRSAGDRSLEGSFGRVCDPRGSGVSLSTGTVPSQRPDRREDGRGAGLTSERVWTLLSLFRHGVYAFRLVYASEWNWHSFGLLARNATTLFVSKRASRQASLYCLQRGSYSTMVQI